MGFVTTASNAAAAERLGKLDVPRLAERCYGDSPARIQVVELNALAAAWAVLRWKRHLGFYVDGQDEQHSLFTISGNTIDDELA